MLLAAPIAAAALTLIALGALLTEYVADPSGLAMHAAHSVAAAVTWLPVEVVAWIGVLIVVGFVLLVVRRRSGTAGTLLALAVSDWSCVVRPAGG